MKITPDTNILVRAVTRDDARQADLAESMMRDAELMAITLPALCEFVWVLERGRAVPAGLIVEAIEKLIASSRVETNRTAVRAGLANMQAGGDFADAAIADEGHQMGGITFATFDKKAATSIARTGRAVKLLA